MLVLLLVGALVSFFVSSAIEEMIKYATGVRLPIALVAALLPIVVLVRRLRRKLAGEPFVVVNPSWAPAEVLYIQRDSPKMFGTLFAIEIAVWVAPALVQLGLLWQAHYFDFFAK